MPYRRPSFFLCLLICPSVASAAVTITYSGTMSGGTDQTGFLFAPGTDLTGKAFTATFTLDETVAGATVSETSTTQDLSGSGASNSVQGYLTIDGASTLHFGDTQGSSHLWDHTWLDYIETSANNTPSTPGFYTYENITLFMNNYDNGVSFYPNDLNYSVQPTDYGGGSFVLQTLSFTTFQNTRYVSGSFNIQSITIANQSVVPEPSSWAMMLTGFGAAGIALLRRRSRKELAECAP